MTVCLDLALFFDMRLTGTGLEARNRGHAEFRGVKSPTPRFAAHVRALVYLVYWVYLLRPTGTTR